MNLDPRMRQTTGASDLSLYGGAPILFGAPFVAFGTADPVVASMSATTGNNSSSIQAAPKPVVASWWAEPVIAGGGLSSAGSMPVKMLPSQAALKDVPPAKDVAAHPGTASPAALSTVDRLELREADPRPEPPQTDANQPAEPHSDGAGVASMPAVNLLAGLDGRVANVEAAIGLGGGFAAAQDQVGDTVDARIEAVRADVADRVDTLSSGVSDDIEAIRDEIDTLVETASHGMEAIVATLPDPDLAGLAGANPAAGITTLVSMVTASDLFGLTDIAPPGSGLITAGAYGSDAFAPPSEFAEAVPADVLLGVADPEHGPLGLLGLLSDDSVPGG